MNGVVETSTIGRCGISVLRRMYFSRTRVVEVNAPKTLHTSLGAYTTHASNCTSHLMVYLCLRRLLQDCNPVSERERNTLRLGSDTDVALDRSLFSLLNRQVRQCVLAKQASCAQVGGEEVAVARERSIRRQACHIGRLHDVVKVDTEIAIVSYIQA